MSSYGRFAGGMISAAIGLLAGCAFPPDLGEGRVRCASDGTCPPAYYCAGDKRCYKSGWPDLAATDLASRDFGACLPTCNIACSPCCQQTCANSPACEVDCPIGGCDCRMGCSNTKSCSINCSPAGRCSGTMDNATTASLTCSAKSTCHFLCTGASTCLLDCRGDASCSVRCVSPAVCVINGPCTKMLTCPDGTLVCNGTCP